MFDFILGLPWISQKRLLSSLLTATFVDSYIYFDTTAHILRSLLAFILIASPDKSYYIYYKVSDGLSYRVYEKNNLNSYGYLMKWFTTKSAKIDHKDHEEKAFVFSMVHLCVLCGYFLRPLYPTHGI